MGKSEDLPLDISYALQTNMKGKSMRKKIVFENLLFHRSKFMMLLQSLIIVFLIVFTYLLVYLTGGVIFVFSHFMYVPILFASFIFDVWGGLLAALIGGLVLGPFMPLDITTGLMQTPSNWGWRCLFFLAVGGIQGCISLYLKKHFRSEKWSLTHRSETGLPNLESLETYLAGLRRTHKSNEKCRLGVLRIDNYDYISSTFGKEISDRCIKEIFLNILDWGKQRNLMGFHIFRETMCFCYVSEFSSTDKIVSKIQKFTATPIFIDTIPFYLNMKLGTSFQIIGDLDPAELIQDAQIASFAASHDKMVHVSFQDSFKQTARKNLTILGSVPQAIADREFSLAFQPIIKAEDGSTVAVEALLRWHSPSLGSLSPGLFIPLVEDTSLIDLLQDWVLKEAFSSLERLNRVFPTLKCSINLSATTLYESKLAIQIEELLSYYQISPGNVIFEVTETAVMSFPDKALKTLNKLKELGCSLSLDDFGTGFSSLVYLESIPADIIKIDQIFIKNMILSDQTKLLLEWLIAYTKTVDLKVVAEGVDTREKMEFLKTINCDYLQGYYFAKPLSYDTLIPWIQENLKTIF